MRNTNADPDAITMNSDIVSAYLGTIVDAINSAGLPIMASADDRDIIVIYIHGENEQLTSHLRLVFFQPRWFDSEVFKISVSRVVIGMEKREKSYKRIGDSPRRSAEVSTDVLGTFESSLRVVNSGDRETFTVNVFDTEDVETALRRWAVMHASSWLMERIPFSV